MVRIILGAIAGFVSWLVFWFGAESIFSAASPGWFGRHQAAFQAAIENGGAFEPDTVILIIHCVMAGAAAAAAGFIAAIVAGENRRAPLAVGLLLLGLGLMKAAMSWPYVPIWYHAAFTAILLPAAIAGGHLKRSN